MTINCNQTYSNNFHKIAERFALLSFLNMQLICNIACTNFIVSFWISFVQMILVIIHPHFRNAFVIAANMKTHFSFLFTEINFQAFASYIETKSIPLRSLGNGIEPLKTCPILEHGASYILPPHNQILKLSSYCSPPLNKINQ